MWKEMRMVQERECVVVVVVDDDDDDDEWDGSESEREL